MRALLFVVALIVGGIQLGLSAYDVLEEQVKNTAVATTIKLHTL